MNHSPFYLEKLTLKDGKCLYCVMSLARSFEDLGQYIIYLNYFKHLDLKDIYQIPVGTVLESYSCLNNTFHLDQTNITNMPISSVGFVSIETYKDLIADYDLAKIYDDLPTLYLNALNLLWKQECQPTQGLVKGTDYLWGDTQLTIIKNDLGDTQVYFPDVLDKLEACNYHTQAFDKVEVDFVTYDDLRRYFDKFLPEKDVREGIVPQILSDVKKYIILYEATHKD